MSTDSIGESIRGLVGVHLRSKGFQGGFKWVHGGSKGNNLPGSKLTFKNMQSFTNEFIIFQVLSYLEKKKDMAKNC